MSNNQKLFLIPMFLGLTLIGIGWAIMIIEMLIDNQCYQLIPNDNYKKTICEKYWKEEEK